MSKDFSELVGEALGRASMAWSEPPVGIFDSDACCVLHIDIMNAYNEEFKNLQAENAKLRECVEFYANGYATEVDDSYNSYFENGHIKLSSGKRARQVLKELDNNQLYEKK